MTAQREKILALLGKHGALGFDELYRHLEEVEDKPALSALLCAMKKDGEVAQAAPRQPYTLPRKRGDKKPLPVVTPPAEAKRHARRLLTAAPAAVPPARAVLAKNAEATQAALDDYLAAVADPRILGPLKASRDGAREALAAFDVENGPGA